MRSGRRSTRLLCRVRSAPVRFCHPAATSSRSGLCFSPTGPALEVRGGRMRRDALLARTIVFLALAGGAAALAAPRASAQQRTTLTRKERPLASLPFDSADSRGVVVSPDGTRGAYAKRIKGGSQLVVIDGNVSEQPYDQIGRN